MNKQIVSYGFVGYPELFFYNDTFWFKEYPCKKVYNGGTIQIRCNKFKFSKGLKTLRKLAYKTEIQKQNTPF